MIKGTSDKGTMDTGKSKKSAKKKKVSTKKDTTPAKKITIEKFKDLEGKFLLVKVGDNTRPATDKDIKDIEVKLVALFEQNDVNCLAFVTHHVVEMEIIEKLI